MAARAPDPFQDEPGPIVFGAEPAREPGWRAAEAASFAEPRRAEPLPEFTEPPLILRPDRDPQAGTSGLVKGLFAGCVVGAVVGGLIALWLHDREPAPEPRPQMQAALPAPLARPAPVPRTLPERPVVAVAPPAAAPPTKAAASPTARLNLEESANGFAPRVVVLTAPPPAQVTAPPPPPMPRAVEIPSPPAIPPEPPPPPRLAAAPPAPPDPELVMADRRLGQAYDRAMASTPDRPGLHDDQAQWLRDRERLAGNRQAWLAVTEGRIAELTMQDRRDRRRR